MAELDAILEKYTNPDTGSIHGASFVAVDSTGNDIYCKSFGYKNVNVKNSKRLTLDTPSWIASQTKLTTSVAVMQVVEKGLIGLDDDVRDVLPQLKDLKVLIGFEGEGSIAETLATSGDEGPYSSKPVEKPKGPPIFEKIMGKLTLRHLITHTSGFCYDLADPLLIKYSAWTERKDNMFSGTMQGNLHPLIFQPGSSWKYGPGLDWAGTIVAKLTGLDFNEYQQKHIWGPLGAKNTTFFPNREGLEKEDLHETGIRAEGEGTQGLKPGDCLWRLNSRDALGGAGLFSTPNDYKKLLSALISEGGPLLSKASVDEMFRPQIGPESTLGARAFLKGTNLDNTQSNLYTDRYDEWENFQEIGHCLCGIVTTEDVFGRRKKGSINWSGLPNLIWWIDRESGVAATFFTQLLPVGDHAPRRLQIELEAALYKAINGK
ncbi:beta-lactamase class C and other penicillin binding protein [Aaosphaeria arxii CBS 175.79]|uniref:Beta-lactamase class C and other penicillin binding protein n=1 Tax=Aaosphaeria arxii CBS 175.79 TaxID=1450172 RepID=A0A6A5X7F1_9PLEO|nr:beta-lactamase class C and other penicillin binding protein [Aaosphaeria arxii CBS 175.79]KAF2008714.1 beta-lactamase class C and other penicillin binding protein [Aaosphaeria arxii CBS 175.79]